MWPVRLVLQRTLCKWAALFLTLATLHAAKWSLIKFIGVNSLRLCGVPTLGLVVGVQLAFLGVYAVGLAFVVKRLRCGLAYTLLWATREGAKTGLSPISDADLAKALRL